MKKYVIALSVLIVLTGIVFTVQAQPTGDKDKELLKDVKGIKDTIHIENIDSNKEKILNTLDGAPIITEDPGSGIGRAIFINRVNSNAAARSKSGGSTCYKLMGVKWTKLPVDYVINPTNTNGLTETFISSAISQSTATWNEATSKMPYGAYSINYGVQYGTFDNSNDIAFGYNSNTGTIAITTVWYYTSSREIVEFDQQYNTYYNWGDVVTTGNTGLMDLQNIATHELGHGIGLSDIYTSSCGYVTMYGYSSNGDTQKRTLAQPDIAGVQKIYGK